MRWPIIKTIWLREIRDQLRDRRTLFMLLVLPLLLYPGLGMAAAQFSVLFAERSLTIGVAGSALLEEDAAPQGSDPRLTLKKLPRLIDAKEGLFAESLFDEDETGRSQLKVVLGDRIELAERLRKGEIQAFLRFSPEFVTRVKRGQQAVVDLHLSPDDQEVSPIPITAATPSGAPEAPLLSAEDDRGRQAYERVRQVLREWSRRIAEARMNLLAAPPQYQLPLLMPRLRPKVERIWSQIFPFLIVMMSLTGALYPAIDVCAGEKERGTMETLLISPATRGEIVMGKFLSVWLFSAVTALLNLASLGFTAWQFFAQASTTSAALTGAERASLPVPGLAALGWCVVLLVPLAAFFSAVCLALAVYARSTKEGQYFLMPLLLITLPLAMLSLAPGVELTPLYSMLPITGPALLLQALINARTTEQLPWMYLAPVLLPLGAYCYLALHWAIQQFNREEVLFREAERIDLRLWLRRLFREKEPLPSAGQAMFCFVAIMMLRWIFSPRGIYDPLVQTAFQLLVFVATPALLMAVMLTSRPMQTLRLQLPRPLSAAANPRSKAAATWTWTALGLALAALLHIPLVMTASWIVEQFPDVVESLKHLERVVETLLGKQTPLATQLLVIALLPAVCEELAFRGFILSGLIRRMGSGKAILVSSLLFAFAHLDAFRFVTTFGLGLVLGLLAVRSGSLLPGMVFHFFNNAWIPLGRYAALNQQVPDWLLTDHGLYQPWVMLVSGILALILLAALLKLPGPAETDSTEEAAGS